MEDGESKTCVQQNKKETNDYWLEFKRGAIPTRVPQSFFNLAKLNRL